MHIDLGPSLSYGWPVLIKNEADRKFLRDQYPWIFRRHNVQVWGDYAFPREIIDETDPSRELSPFESNIIPPLAFAVLAKNIVPGITGFSIDPSYETSPSGPEIKITLVREDGELINCLYGLYSDDGDWKTRRQNIVVYFRQLKPYKTILGLTWSSKKEDLECFSKNDAWFYQAFEKNLKALISENKTDMEKLGCEGDEFAENLLRARPSIS